jgi:diguanylate cyclase (GGDEF)-like protein
LADGLPKSNESGDDDSLDLPFAALIRGMSARAQDENPLLHHITDAATGLFNQAYMELKLTEEFKKARRFSLPLSLVSVGFAQPIPSEEESKAGRRHARLLNEVAGVLLCESRDIDHVGRNGDDFLLILAHTDQSGAVTMGERILNSLRSRGLSSTQETNALPVLTVGIASMEQGPIDNSETLVQRAVEAQKVASSEGWLHCRVWGADLNRARS